MYNTVTPHVGNDGERWGEEVWGRGGGGGEGTVRRGMQGGGLWEKKSCDRDEVASVCLRS